MANTNKTIERLRQFHELHLQGCRGDIVDRSLDKLLSLERAAAERELAELQQRLAEFEQQCAMSSSDFSQDFRAGKLRGSADFVEWRVFYEMSESVHERLKRFAAEAA